MRKVDWNDLQWLNPPADAARAGEDLMVTSLAGSDFWRTTHYGFVHDNGHFLGMPVDGDVAVEATFVGEFSGQWDQAGLFIRADAREWIKAGVEYVDGVLQASVVVTHDRSDWSVGPLPRLSPTSRVTVRASRKGDSVTIRLWPDGGEPQTIRVAYLAPEARVRVGLMCCSDRAGLRVRFEPLRIDEPDPEAPEA